MLRIIFTLAVYAINIFVGDFFVKSICQKLNLPKTKNAGLLKAGRIIGYFERFIIFTFLLRDSYEAVAFIFAGKSIVKLRYKEESEYYLVGTLASISWAML